MLFRRSSTSLILVALLSNIFHSASAAPFVRKELVASHSPVQQVGPHAQCLTHITPEEKVALEDGIVEMRKRSLAQDLEDRDLFGSDNETFRFNVSFNIVFTNETREGGWVPDADVQAQVETLNKDYNDTGISFVLVKTTRIKNPEWFVHAYPGSDQEQAMKKMYNIGDASTLNIYTLTFNSTTKSLGTASIPSAYYRDPKSDGVMIRHSTVTNGPREHYNLGRTLTHEVGHWLGLFHTFEGGCDDSVGDNISDTPPQASSSEGCPVGRDSCPGDGPDLINNFMDYSYDACMSSFTRGQAIRMRESAKAFRMPGGKTAPPPKPKPTANATMMTQNVVNSTQVVNTGTVIFSTTTLSTVSSTASSTSPGH